MGDLESFRSGIPSRPHQKDPLTYVIYKGQKYYIDISKLKTERPSQHRTSTISSDSMGSEDSNGYLIMHSPLEEENNYNNASGIASENFLQNSSPMTKIEFMDQPQVTEKKESPRNRPKKYCHSCCNVIFWTIFTTPLTVSALLMYFLFNDSENTI